MQTKTEQEWRAKLTPEQFRVLRRNGTEAPFTGAYAFAKDDGMYHCAACDNALFSSDAKFDSGTGWPSFTEAAVAANVVLREDHSHGMTRTEVRCANCDSHLGHVFDDGPAQGQQRFCINSCALDLKPTS